MIDQMTVKELRALAREYGIHRYSKMRKDELRNAILQYQQREENKMMRDEQEKKTREEERKYAPRQQINPHIACLKEPFSFVQEYRLKATPIPGDEIFREEHYEDFTDFPKIIDHYFWVQEGENDGKPWKCLVKIDDGVAGSGTYAYFEAGCDYTGFDCQGWMKAWVSHYYHTLVKFVMDEETYQQYLKDTREVEAHGCCANCKGYGFPCLNCAQYINSYLVGYHCSDRYCKNGEAIW